jgi:hypothetical protein
MVFIESPCGVGFSYSDTPSDYFSSDSSTALNNYHFIQGFLRRFPEYSENDLYLSSESYGGHCKEYNQISFSSTSYPPSFLLLSTDLPTLAKEIVDQNYALTQQPPSDLNLLLLKPLNLKGFAVGNPYTTVYTGLHAMIETGWGHHLISQPTYQQFRSNHCLEMDTPNYPVSSLTLTSYFH